MFNKENIIDLINPYSEIIITGHIKPDGDAVGSCLAVALFLEKIGKKPRVLLEEYHEKFNIIFGKEFIVRKDLDKLNCEVFIFLDCGSNERIMPEAKKLLENAKVTINIDHHISNNNFADYNFVNPKASSTCEVVYELFKDNIPIDKKIATNLYGGIVTDSGGFRFNSTSPRTMEIATKLMNEGIDFSKIYSTLMIRKTLSEITALQTALNNMELDLENKISYSFITLEEMEKLKIDKIDLQGIAQQILNIEEIEIAAFFYELEKDVYKISLRSKSFDVNKVAGKFSGGGHINAAGCIIKENKQKSFEIIRKEILNQLKK